MFMVRGRVFGWESSSFVSNSPVKLLYFAY